VVEAALTRIRPRLAGVWVAFLALAGIIAALEYGERAESPAKDREAAWLLPAPVDELGAIELGHAGKLRRFERDGTGAWFYHGAHDASQADHVHEADPAMARRIADAFVAFGRTRIERRLPFDPQSRQYGVTTPTMLIVVYPVNDPRPLAQYAIGDIAPDTFSRYVLRAGSTEVVTIPNYQIDNLLALVESHSANRSARSSAPGNRALAIERSP
jgi:hypothetical protein